VFSFLRAFNFDGDKFGTAVTCLAFRELSENSGTENGMASPTGTAASQCLIVEGISDLAA
jgi:hypothetical protein